MKSKKNIKHRGEVLRETVNESGLKITEIVKKAKFSRGSYYNHIKDPELPYDTLEKYGKAMRYDFSEEFPILNSLRLEEEEIVYGTPGTLEEALQKIERLRENYSQLSAKYTALLEKHNAFLEGKK